ncbi:MAG: phosphomannomutase/phosphoglucomutase [Clostridia bacterium]|nr:phosphomannomutase/phosphoglucomutase [Clostridia bacterium]
MSYKELQNGSDVRGIALGEKTNLTEKGAAHIAAAFAGWLAESCGKEICELKIAVGRDSRITGPALAEAVLGAFAAKGVKAMDAGMASTPAMFMSCVFPETDCDGAVMLTASHLPSDRNGLKFFEKKKGGLDKGDIKAILASADELAAAECEGAENCSCEKSAECAPEKTPLMEIYCRHLKSLISADLGLKPEDKPLAGLKIVVDAGNGAGGFYASEVLAPLGADVSGSQFLEPDGTFPNHAPNPEDKKAMESFSARVKECGADLGIIFDTDVDRMAVAGSDGKEINRNGIVALAALMCQEGPAGEKGTIVTDSITSTQLAEFLAAKGYKHLRFKRGYKNVINKGIELNAAGEYCPLAIETSGHAALKENYFLDDGAYLATKIVVKAAQLRKEGKAVESLIADLAEPMEAKEFRLPVLAEDFADYADSVLADLTAKIEKGEGICCGMSLEEPNYEGIRVNCDAENGDGWFLLRKSLHDPLMPLNIESNKAGGVAEIAAKASALLKLHDKLDISSLEK